MFQKLVSRNQDLARLVERGYAVAFDQGHLIVRDIPYLDSAGNLQSGAIVSKLVSVDGEVMQQQDHQIYFAGSHPYDLQGRQILNLGGGATSIALAAEHSDVVVQRSFSNKPKATGKFADHFEKIESYVAIISGPAIEKHMVTPYTYRADKTEVKDAIFKLQDTLTSRAGIAELNAGFADEKIAIIGLGGTGAFLLDYAVKARIPNIVGFDGDDFHVHNAYRSPGKLDEAELGCKKADVYQARYEPFRHGLSLRANYITSESAEELEGVTFAFVCVDKGSARNEIFDLLIELGIPFIDVGMGLKRKDGPISGMMRATYFEPGIARELKAKGLAETADGADNLYRDNIQISELNALNACLAMIRYKQLREFYRSAEANINSLFEIADLSVINVRTIDEL
ncbi:ThiF family adenylyltransferase [Sphingomicrobium astaxanthinifaciens]|uniref:ThiF family adenylyltransferase n=1 Tax=Sphingomicrobium astaxanthinifaciens TaxID=1227949 RepID=UPI001FCAF39D|nr:ThiF family adenylyltransferase [Sphingomicrobium astaxanthinifaciens]MCJ7420448.1 ThiF family adenylyltransferase [Sphingomicrobium astaxanthinifaciens]